jgi:apolipoprotein D and lipocalin family protein
MKGSAWIAIGLLAFARSAAAASAPEPRTVARVDLERYAGRWYEVARYPNRFQKHCAGDVVVEYSSRKDGGLDIDNRCRDERGGEDRSRAVAKVAAPDGSNSKLRVNFAPRALAWLPLPQANYWILELADDYSYAAVGTPDRDYLWILSRQPSLEASVLERLEEAVRAQGFDPGRLEKTAHSAP